MKYLLLLLFTTILASCSSKQHRPVVTIHGKTSENIAALLKEWLPTKGEQFVGSEHDTLHGKVPVSDEDTLMDPDEIVIVTSGGDSVDVPIAEDTSRRMSKRSDYIIIGDNKRGYMLFATEFINAVRQPYGKKNYTNLGSLNALDALTTTEALKQIQKQLDDFAEYAKNH